MSRAGYIDDVYDQEAQWQLIRWRGAVNSALRGRRGQAFLRGLARALDAMPEKRLEAGTLRTSEGEFCVLGAYYQHAGIQIPEMEADFDDGYLSDDDYATLASDLNIAEAMARELMYENDEGAWNETPKHRWQRMRAWVAGQILPAKEADPAGQEDSRNTRTASQGTARAE